MEMLENLKKIKGHNFEDIVQILENQKIQYSISKHPGFRNNYFRDSQIKVFEYPKEFIGDYEPHVEKGYKRSSFRENGVSFFYYAIYEPLAPLDPLILNGDIRMEGKNLAERVTIFWIKK